MVESRSAFTQHCINCSCASGKFSREIWMANLYRCRHSNDRNQEEKCGIYFVGKTGQLPLISQSCQLAAIHARSQSLFVGSFVFSRLHFHSQFVSPYRLPLTITSPSYRCHHVITTLTTVTAATAVPLSPPRSPQTDYLLIHSGLQPRLTQSTLSSCPQPANHTYHCPQPHLSQSSTTSTVQQDSCDHHCHHYHH